MPSNAPIAPRGNPSPVLGRGLGGFGVPGAVIVIAPILSVKPSLFTLPAKLTMISYGPPTAKVFSTDAGKTKLAFAPVAVAIAAAVVTPSEIVAARDILVVLPPK